ncbi:hypothetical protein FRB95_009692 [Tulasnella sp. JGI-2019a]|nr:hypothetical protein FRB95_009692 [Tulasnella sp. JGI-2019a]
MASTSTASRATRPPFRYQNTQEFNPTRSSAQEKSRDVEPMEYVDEKARPGSFSGAGSSSHATRGHARTTSRDVIHTQFASPRRSPDSRTLPPISAAPASRTQQAQRYHSHPPPPTISFSAHRQIPPVEVTTCCGISVSRRVKTWIPFASWVATSLAFVVAIGFWRAEVFQGLEALSEWIKEEGNEGQAILFFLIFVTTFPPMPLYSTLIMLSGYSLGAIQGAILSYFAALTGAIAVFLLSRTYLRSSINEMISNAPISVKRAIRAIEKQPKLLFLIRLSPYPYNLMNALLATSRISFTTYTTCTALSLFKVIVHTTIGASIHSFSEYHTHTTDGDSTESGNDEGDGDMSKVWTVVGIVLCVSLLVYLSWVARRAVDDAEDEEDCLPITSRGRCGRGRLVSDTDGEDERDAFLSPMAQDDSRRPSIDGSRLTNGYPQMSGSPLQMPASLPPWRANSPHQVGL